MLIVQERKRVGGGGDHSRSISARLNPCRGGRVSALISVSSHLTDRRKSVTLAKVAEGG